MNNIAFVSMGKQSSECADILVKSIKKNNYLTFYFNKLFKLPFASKALNSSYPPTW